MKNLTFSIALIAGILGACPLVGYSQYSTDFNSFNPGTYIAPSPATPSPGQDGWVTNDLENGFDGNAGAFVGNSNFVGFIPGYSSLPTDYWAKLGGGLSDGGTPILPGQQTSYLFRPFSLATNVMQFNTTFSITSSSVGKNKDTFGWSIRVGTANYATLLFTPQTNVVYDSLPDGPKASSTNAKLNISLVTSTNAVISTTQAIIYDSAYSLQVNIDSTGSLTALINGGGVDLNNQNVSPSSPSGVTNVAAAWDLRDKTITPATNVAQTGSGDNAIIYNNYSAVPEPSTVGLFALAGLLGVGALVRSKRKVA